MNVSKQVTALALGLLCGTAMAQTQTASEARLSPSRTVQFDVFLPLQHTADLDALIHAQQDPNSASYHKWLKPAEFEQRYGASDATRKAVQDELSAYGMSVTASGSRHLHVSGAARSVEQAFSTNLTEKTAANGVKTMAMSSSASAPAALASSGAVVVGLSNAIHMHTQSVKLAKVDNRYSNEGPYWFTDLKQAYTWPSYNALSGKGSTIGILIAGGYNPPDMDLYFKHEKLATPHYSEVDINGGAPYDPNNSFETHLDMQQTGGMAPDADIIVYNIPDLSDLNIITGLLTIITSNTADVVSMSFGGAEVGYLPSYNGGQDFSSYARIYDDLFAQGNAQGITFVASSGDFGAKPVPPPACFDANATAGCGSVQLSVELPAASPHVVGVGGTNLVTTLSTNNLNSKYISENAFGDPVQGDIEYGTPATGLEWGSGGGDSIFFKKPDYQKLLKTGSKVRAVPDVSLHMGGCPQGSVLPCGPQRSSDIVAIAGALYGVIGTSASAPDFAGLLALKIQRTKGRLGNENEDIYTLAAEQKASHSTDQYFRTDIPGENNGYIAGGDYSRVLGVGTVVGKTFVLRPNAASAGTPQTPSNP